MEKTERNTANLPEQGGQFKKEIGLFGGVSILGGIMIGSGIFYLGSYVLIRTGMSLGLALLCWLVGGIVSLLGGLCYAELGASDPSAGGATVYLNKAYSPLVGFLSGFNSFLLSGPGSIAGLAVALPTALQGVLGLDDLGVKLFAIALIIALTAVNLRGVKLGSLVQNLSMVGKLIPIFIILVLGLTMGKVNPELTFVPATGAVGPFKLISMMAFAVVATLWAYEGWTNLNLVAEEIKNPRRNLPLSIIIAIVSITALYTLFNYAIYRVIPYEQILSSIEAKEFYLGTAAAQALLGDAGRILVISAMVISMFGSLNGCILAFPRNYYAMAKEGTFFDSFAILHPKYGVPTAATIVQAVISIVLVVFRSLDQLTSLVVFSGMMFKVLVVYAVIVYRKKFPNLERPYKVFLYPVTVILTTIIFIGLMINTLIEDPVTSIIGFIVPVIGFFLYNYFVRRNRARA